MTDQDEFISQLPSTYWRVSAKALVFDAEGRLLVCMDKNHEWEIPGGGWEHDETFEECLKRELAEEVQVGVTNISDVVFCYKCTTINDYPKISIVAKVMIDDAPITPTGDDLVEAKYVTKEEFLRLPFQHGEDAVQAYADTIWARAL